MNKVMISFTQILFTRLFRLSHAYTWQVNGGIPTIDPQKTYVFISNHQSRIDPFVIFACMDLHSNIKAAPVKFMTAKSIYYGFFRPLLFCLGCFPTYVRNQNIIDYSAQLVKNGYGLFIFPEGRRTLKEHSSPKDGILRIIDQLDRKDVEYVLAYIDWTKPSWRRHATIKFGSARSIDHESASLLMKQIYSL